MSVVDDEQEEDRAMELGEMEEAATVFCARMLAREGCHRLDSAIRVQGVPGVSREAVDGVKKSAGALIQGALWLNERVAQEVLDSAVDEVRAEDGKDDGKEVVAAGQMPDRIWRISRSDGARGVVYEGDVIDHGEGYHRAFHSLTDAQEWAVGRVLPEEDRDGA